MVAAKKTAILALGKKVVGKNFTRSKFYYSAVPLRWKVTFLIRARKNLPSHRAFANLS